jgi:hypothetical protein
MEQLDNVMMIIGGLITVATAVTAMTDSPKDDVIVAKIKKAVALFSVTKFKDEIKDPAKPTANIPVAGPAIKLIGGLIKKRRGK